MPWETLLLSTVLYVVLPLVAGVLDAAGAAWGAAARWRSAPFVKVLKPWSVVGLIATVVLLFGFQAQTIVAQPAVIVADRRAAADPDLRHLRRRLHRSALAQAAP